MPNDTRELPANNDALYRFLGGSPLAVAFRLILLSILVGQFLGVRQVPITYETQGETRIVHIEKYVDGAITPVRGKEQGNVVIRNSEYWIGPDIIVSRADKSRFRGFGRNWNLAGRSAEIVKLDWGNQ